MPARTCNAHTSGVPVDAPPFYSKGCTMCEVKKAAGKVTGNEPPLAHGWRRIRDKATRIDWTKRAPRDERTKAARLKALGWLGWR